jgi:DNA topoisomerase IA
MKVCIAEKPSVAREIAAILGANTKRDGFYEGNGYAIVTLQQQIMVKVLEVDVVRKRIQLALVK